MGEKLKIPRNQPCTPALLQKLCARVRARYNAITPAASRCKEQQVFITFADERAPLHVPCTAVDFVLEVIARWHTAQYDPEDVLWDDECHDEAPTSSDDTSDSC